MRTVIVIVGLLSVSLLWEYSREFEKQKYTLYPTIYKEPKL